MDFRGGARPGAGRKQIGETRRISVTLPPEVWKKIDSEGEKTAQTIRKIIFREFGYEK